MNILNPKQLIKIDCIKHANNKIQFIQINEIKDNKNLFYCNHCLNYDEDDYNFKNFLNVDIIQQIDENQILDKFPPLIDYSIHKKIQQCNQQNVQLSQLPSKIETFFENLKSDIFKSIDSVKKIMINNCQSFSNNTLNIQEKYQELSQLKILKQILTESNIDTVSKENKFREFIKELQFQKQKNSEQLTQLIQQHEEQMNLVDFETPDKIKSTIIHLIDQINIFSLDQNIFEQLINIQNQNNFKLNTSVLFDLISTKSNNCSEKFLISIKSLLNQISPLIERIPFEDAFIKDKKPIDFSNINDHYLDLISDVSHNLTSLSKESQEQMNNKRNTPEIKQIMNVLNLKLNYLNQDFLIEFEKYLIETYPFLNKMKFLKKIKKFKHSKKYLKKIQIILCY